MLYVYLVGIGAQAKILFIVAIPQTEIALLRQEPTFNLVRKLDKIPLGIIEQYAVIRDFDIFIASVIGNKVAAAPWDACIANIPRGSLVGAFLGNKQPKLEGAMVFEHKKR